MGKIRGKFTPIFSELGDDERFLLRMNDRQKLLFLLIMHTIYQTNNAAPRDPIYYQYRYNMGSINGKKRLRRTVIESDIVHILDLYPKILCDGKKLSLLKYIGYENRVANKGYIEGEGELEKKEKEKENLQPPPPIEQKKDLPELLRNPLFRSLSESEKERIKDAYPKDFLIDRLSHYAESARTKPDPITLMQADTIRKFLAKDFGDWNNLKAREAQNKKESARDRKKELEENAAPPPEEFKQLKKKLKGEADEEEEEKSRSAGQVCA